MNASPPGPDISKGALVVGITTFLHIISLSLFGVRIYTRVRPTLRLGLDDYFLALAVVCVIVTSAFFSHSMKLHSLADPVNQLFDVTEWILLLIGVRYGVGRHNFYLTPYETEQAEKFLFISQPPYAWALAFAKLSIIWMLIRIQRDHKVWKIFLYFMMAFVTLTSVTMNVFQFSLCKPLAAIWDHSIDNPVCLPPAVGQMSIYVTAAMTILTDFTLSLLPLSFIVHIQRPWREKIALACVMGLGVVASSASIVKTTLVKDYGINGNVLPGPFHLLPLAILVFLTRTNRRRSDGQRRHHHLEYLGGSIGVSTSSNRAHLGAELCSSLLPILPFHHTHTQPPARVFHSLGITSVSETFPECQKD